MRRALIIGCGDVALRAIPLLTKHYRLFGLVRSREKFATLRAMGVTPLWGDLDDRVTLLRIAGLAELVLHLAPPPNAGMQDTRTRNLLSVLAKGALPQHLVYVSTSGVYGDCAGAWVDETHRTHPVSLRSLRRIDAERQLRDWARRNRVNLNILRVSGIYAAERLPLSRIQQGIPAIFAEEDNYSNHIHADDLARTVVSSIPLGRPCRVYHVSDDSFLKMGEYFDLVADACGLPRVPRISRAEAQRVLPDGLLSFTNESRRLTNQRMRYELKVRLRYPTVRDMLQDMKMRDATTHLV